MFSPASPSCPTPGCTSCCPGTGKPSGICDRAPLTRGHPPGAHSRSHTFAQSRQFAKAVLSRGFADGRLRSATLNQPEADAISEGESLREQVEKHLGDMPLVASDSDTEEVLEQLSWMVSRGYLEVKVAVPCDSNGKPVENNALCSTRRPASSKTEAAIALLGPGVSTRPRPVGSATGRPSTSSRVGPGERRSEAPRPAAVHASRRHAGAHEESGR